MVDKTDDLVLSISTDAAPLKRALRLLGQEVDSFSKNAIAKFEKAGLSMDKSMATATQQRINEMVGASAKATDATKEWTGALANQSEEMTRLRAKYSPMFATIKQYKDSVAGIQQAHKLGAISSEEMTSAIQRERKATLDSIAAIKQRNSATSSMKPATTIKSGVSNFNTANIAAQFQDIAVTSAMGMSPMQIALQQGTQLSSVFATMGKGTDVIKGIGAAFTSLISPVSLVTLGVIAGGVALAQYFTSAKDTEKLSAAFKAHADSIAAVKQRYTDLNQSVLDLRPEGVATQIRALKDELSSFYSTVGDEAKRAASFGAPALTELANSFKQVPAAGQAMQSAFAALNYSISQGRPDLLSFREAMSKLANDMSNPESVREYAKGFSQLDADALKAARSIPSVENAIRILGDAASGEVARVREFSAALRELSGIAMPQLDDRDLAAKQYSIAVNRATDRASKDDAYSMYQSALDRIDQQERMANMPVPGEKPNFESFAPEKKKRSSSDRKAERDANAYRDLVKSANDRIDQLRLEEQLVGKTGVAAETMRMKLELLQKAQDKGRTVSAAQRAEIDALAESYGKAAERVAAMQMAEDLQFERAQMFRSPTEQKVSSQLRGAGIDANSGYGQFLAQQIRLNEKLAEAKDLATDFAQGFAQDLLNGASAMDALKNAAGRLGSKLIEMGTNQVINSLFGSLAGSFGGGGFQANTTLGNFIKGIPGFASGTNSAPGGLSLVGENGPELVNLQRGAQVIPNDILRSMSNMRVGGPRVPSIPSAANSNSSSITFAPVIDARGADVAAVARLERVLAEQNASFEARVVGTMRQAKSTLNWK